MKDDIRVLRDENDQIRKWTLGLLVAILVAIIGTFFIQIREARVDGKVLASEIAAELRNDGRGTK